MVVLEIKHPSLRLIIVCMLNGAVYTTFNGSIPYPNRTIPSSEKFKLTTVVHESDTARYNTKDIYAIRLYNRELSPQEMLHNQNIDKKRFGE